MNCASGYRSVGYFTCVKPSFAGNSACQRLRYFYHFRTINDPTSLFFSIVRANFSFMKMYLPVFQELYNRIDVLFGVVKVETEANSVTALRTDYIIVRQFLKKCVPTPDIENGTVRISNGYGIL